MGIIQDVQDRIGRYQHYKNRIEREKLMIDPSAIVLMDEFAGKAAAPLVDNSPSYFASLFRLYGTQHNQILQHWISQYAIPVYLMRIADLPEEQQKFALGTLSDENFEKQVAEMRDAYEKGGLDFSLAEEIMRQTHDHDVAEKVHVQAVHLAHIIQAADHARYQRGGSIPHHEKWSLLRDEGADVLGFWKNVNTLRDLSGFFPDKPKPKGNDHDKRKQEARAPVWQPVFDV